ncbi:MAG: hypothetical protein K0U98_22780 [Deltaproteobacteria bacterium]|nr:hypothetical protein [Deltaproteobacteria bacterium]
MKWTVLSVAAATFFFILLGWPVVAAEEGEDFHFDLINGVYNNPNPDIAPVRRGLVTIQLRSPSNEVELMSHQLNLQPLDGGVHRAFLTLEVAGEGQLEADLIISGVSTDLEDDVQLPHQTLFLEGQIRLQRVDKGYEVTVVELPAEIKLKIRSRLATSLVETCKRFSMLIPLGFGCSELERSLAEAAVPLPEEGENFLLSDDLLTAQDRQQLEAYLAR